MRETRSLAGFLGAGSWFFVLLGLAACGQTDGGGVEGVLHEFELRAAADSSDSIDFVDSTPLNVPGIVLRGGPDKALTLADGSGDVPWTLARYLVADVFHEDSSSDILYVEFFRRGEPDEPRIHAKMGILPGLATRVVVPLAYLDGQSFFMARQERRLKGVMPGRRMAADEIRSVRIRVGPTAEGFDPKLWVTGLRLTSVEPGPLPPTTPIVDAVGQWKARDWPGKSGGPEKVTADLHALAEETAEERFPEGWSRFGGWREKRFESTGFFRVERDDSRWWLVDPDGFAFFSVGVDVAIPSAAGPVEGMEDLHEWLPDPQGEFGPAYEVVRGKREFSFLTANWIRAFGADWLEQWRAVTRNLLVGWRFNTIGNWSDLEFARGARLPYVIPLRGFPTTEALLYRDFPDVFSDEYARAAERFAEQGTTFRDDPYLIGYFLDNEPLWAFGDNNLASEMLATAAPSASRREFVAWIRNRYQDDPEHLSSAWNRGFSSFDELADTPIPDAERLSDQAKRDLWEFSGLMVDRYLSLPSAALRRTAPHHLNLGIRYASISSELCYRAGEHFDVFSINSYTMRPEPATIAEITRRTGKPVMIGEFHQGAIDRGLPSTGIRGVASQEDRGVAYRYYVEQGASLPELVGVHFFQLNDQPVLGRFDGENYNIGLVDICNRPYPELTRAARTANERIYDVASGRSAPVEREAKRIPDIYF
jgi:hypothetical protein